METFNKFRSILLGQQLEVHTDHLTYKTFKSDRVLRWRLYIEEHTPDLKYIPGEKNVVADALSRLPMILNEVEDSQENYFTIMESYRLSKVSKETETFDFHPLFYNLINLAQQVDPEIKRILRKDNSNYHIKDSHGGGKTRALVCYKDKIVVSA